MTKNHLFETARFISMILITFLVPIFVFVAVRMFVKANRVSLPGWRTGLGFASAGLTLICWLPLVLLPVFERLGLSTNFFRMSWVSVLLLMALVSVFLSLVLRGKPRIYSLIAGSLIFFGWTLSIVH